MLLQYHSWISNLFLWNYMFVYWRYMWKLSGTWKLCKWCQWFLGFVKLQKISKAAEELQYNVLITEILNRCLHSNLHKLLLEKFFIYILVTELQKSHFSKHWHFGSCINIDMFSNTWMSEGIFNASYYSQDKLCCQAKVLLKQKW